MYAVRFTSVLYALGAGARVVVTDTFSDHPAENRPKATLTTYPKTNLEALVSLVAAAAFVPVA